MTDSRHRSPLLDRSGAVAADGADAGLPAHYGQPVHEQRELEQGCAVVDLSTRSVVTITGPDRLSWLTTLSSQQVTDLPAGGSAELLLLDISGRIEHAPALADDGATAWLITEAQHGPALAAWLDSMRFTLRVEVADRTAEVAALGSVAPLPLPEAVSALASWSDPWPYIAPGGISYAAVEDADHPGAKNSWQITLVPRDQLVTVVDHVEQQQWSLAGSWAAEALRIAGWRPRLAHEVDAKAIPHELDLMRTAVHLSKGCYRGQETVARVHNLGHPPRRLVFLHLDGSEHTLPAVGSDILSPAETAPGDPSVWDNERAVGVLTSVARHHEAGPIGLALVKRRVDPQRQLVVRDTSTAEQETPEKSSDGGGTPGETAGSSAPPSYYAAAQEMIVRPDAGQTVGRPQGDFLRGPRR